MVQQSPVTSTSSLTQYARLLIRLHELMASGRGDEQEADDIRDLMDAPWYKMAESEIVIARQLSADLYTLDPNEESRHPLEDRFSASLIAELNAARQNDDFLQALRLLSQRSSEIGIYRATNLRGSCYEHLGLTDAALHFFENAIGLSSKPSGALVYLLVTLTQSGNVALAAQRARQILHDGAPEDPELHRLCALTLLTFAGQIQGEASHSALLEALAEFRALISRATSWPGNPKEVTQALVESHFGAAECYFLLLEDSHALEHLNMALRIIPNHEPSLTFRGLLNLSTHFDMAKQDFLRATQLNTDSVWPYYYLAYDAFFSEDYPRCETMAAEGLKRAPDRELSALFHELLAISLFMNNIGSDSRPDEDIRRHFRLAIAEAPLNLNFTENHRLFEQFISQQSQPVWNVGRPRSEPARELSALTRPRTPSKSALALA